MLLGAVWILKTIARHANVDHDVLFLVSIYPGEREREKEIVCGRNVFVLSLLEHLGLRGTYMDLSSRIERVLRASIVGPGINRAARAYFANFGKCVGTTRKIT